MSADEVSRIDADAARQKTASGRSLLVCAYDDEDKCRSMLLAGALTLNELEQRKASLDRRQSITLYCA